jgi:hypothetical protein
MKKIKDVTSIKGDLVRLKSSTGNSLVNKYQALKYASEAQMDLYVEENRGDEIPLAEMRGEVRTRK